MRKRSVNRRRFRPQILLGVLASVAALAVIAPAAGAGPPSIATGTWDCRQASVSIESTRTAGGNTIFSHVASGCVYAGDLTGTFSIHQTRHVRSDGSFTDHGRLVCTGCTIGGRTGDFIAQQDFRGTLPATTGKVTVLGATGGLAGLHAQNHFESTGPGFGTYTYKYSFAL
jgi:hypothetical protein